MSLTAPDGIARYRLVLLAAAVVLGSYAVLAVVHSGDRYQLNGTSGVYAGLAMNLNHGICYPELYDGARYGGTRYMPLQFVLHALKSGKGLVPSHGCRSAYGGEVLCQRDEGVSAPRFAQRHVRIGNDAPIPVRADKLHAIQHRPGFQVNTAIAPKYA